MAANLFNENDIIVSQEIRESANPVFNIAKMTLFDLALSGDKDAEEILYKLGLDRGKMQSSLINSCPSRENREGQINFLPAEFFLDGTKYFS